MRVFVLAGVFVLTILGEATSHPFHGSIAEAEWNAKSKKLEVALWVHPGDLEKALRTRSKKAIDLDKTPNVDRLIQKYLGDVFVVTDAKGQRAKLEWVGKEVTVKAAWLYFEVPLPGGLEGATFTQRIFFELLKDQVNTVTFRQGKSRKSTSFTHAKPSRVFSWGSLRSKGGRE